MDEKTPLGTSVTAPYPTGPPLENVPQTGPPPYPPPSYYGSNIESQMETSNIAPADGYGPPTYDAPPPPGPQIHAPRIIQQGVIISSAQLGRFPINCTCPKCNQNVVTHIKAEHRNVTWLLCFLIFILGGGVFCLCLIPFCFDELKDVDHFCPHCHHMIGTHSML